MSGFVNAAAAVGVEETRDCEGAEEKTSRALALLARRIHVYFLLDARMHEHIPGWYHHRNTRESAHPPSFFSLTR